MTLPLESLLRQESLPIEHAEAVMDSFFQGELTPVQMAALLVALRFKGETASEVAGFARAMRRLAVPVPTNRSPLVDTCGTGGDACKTFNISTAAAFVAAAAGANVAKHGNRAVTSTCGSADVLEALGVDINLTPERVGKCIDEVGIGFLFARSHHPAMRHVAPVRAELGIRTVFNLLGPLTNPAGATRQVIGVYAPDLCLLAAEVLQILGVEHALIVHGQGGLDEISLWDRTRVAELRDGTVCQTYLTPELLGLRTAPPDVFLPGADTDASANIMRDILRGEDRSERRDIVLANAAAAIYVSGIAESIVAGVEYAADAIDSGKAMAKLEHLIQFTTQNDES